jgi:hypothetical protein
LELGQEVEYSLTISRNGITGGNCIPAENVRLLPRGKTRQHDSYRLHKSNEPLNFVGTINHPKVLDGTFNGVVIRPLRCINPDQEDYSGLIQLSNENGENVSQHEFGITSLMNKRDLLQKDDCVVFKIDETLRAVEVSLVERCWKKKLLI